MITPFDVWTPMFRAPFSGDVTQEIMPSLITPNIKGVPEIELRVQTEVASYGQQLGTILEALQRLSKTAETPLPEINALVSEIESVKQDSQTEIRAQAKAALARLRAIDEEGWRDVMDDV